MCSTGRLPKLARQNCSSSMVSAMWVCIVTPRSRASVAVSLIRSLVTENGEHGATAICSYLERTYAFGPERAIDAGAPDERTVPTTQARRAAQIEERPR